jgi:hypothetical protein
MAVALTHTANAVDPSNLTTYSFASQSFGAAEVGDYIVIAIASRSTAARTISSVTVDGEAASVVSDGSTNAFVDFPNDGGSSQAALYIAPATGDASGTVSVTFSAGMVRCGIGVFLLTGAATTATEVETDTGSNPSVTLNIGAGGAALGALFSTATSAWSNLTERYDQTIESGFIHSAGSAEFVSAQTNLAVGATNGGATAFVAASFEAEAAGGGLFVKLAGMGGGLVGLPGRLAG